MPASSPSPPTDQEAEADDDKHLLSGLRGEIAQLLERLEEAEASAATIPHRSKYLQLTNGFLRRLLDLHLELVDEVERELAPKTRRPAGRTR